MKLIEIVDSRDLFDVPPLYPQEFRFELDSGEEWTITFVPTVPVNRWSYEEIYEDLFACSVQSINHESRPILRGGSRERDILDRLGGWINANFDPTQQEQILHGLSTRLTEETIRELAWHKHLIWMYRALEQRRTRVETD